MDRLSEQVRPEWRGGLALAPLLLALACGCASSRTAVTAFVPGFADTPTVTTVAAMWKNRVITGVDPAHGGAPMAGLAGRVWLYGDDFKENLLADGKLVVELWGPPPGQPQAPPVRMEVWEIKKDILNSVNKRTDGIGQGYSLSLPWPSYRPDITAVHLRVHYEPDKGGMPVYAQDSVLTLNSGSNGIPVVSRRETLGNGQPVPATPAAQQPVAQAPVQNPGPVQPVVQGPTPLPPGPVQPANFQPQQVMPWNR